MESRITASQGRGKGLEGLTKKEKKAHGHGLQGGDCWGEGGVRGLNDNGNIIKIMYYALADVAQ